MYLYKNIFINILYDHLKKFEMTKMNIECPKTLSKHFNQCFFII